MLHCLDCDLVPLKSLISLSDQLILGIEGMVASHGGVARKTSCFEKHLNLSNVVCCSLVEEKLKLEQS